MRKYAKEKARKRKKKRRFSGSLSAGAARYAMIFGRSQKRWTNLRLGQQQKHFDLLKASAIFLSENSQEIKNMEKWLRLCFGEKKIN